MARMDLKSGYPYWAVKNGLMYAFPRLESDTSCDVLVIGGGISGALIARKLADADFDVAVVEQRDIAWGSTAASTALLQYENDVHMLDLARKYGEPAAALIYRACAEAIFELRDISREVADVGFRRQHSLYLASRRLHRRSLIAEFELRARHGFDVEWLSRHELQERFQVDYAGAIWSELGAQIDPYRMTSRLLRRLHGRGVRIFDRTEVLRVDSAGRGAMAQTRNGFSIRSGHVVIATGYAAQKWLSAKVARNRSSYAYITDPIDTNVLGPWSKTMLWESARPYVYARTTADRRLIIGGEDDAIDLPHRRDRRLEYKTRRLYKRARTIWPLAELEPAFAWAGTFAETSDGLPFFGTHPQYGSRVLFAMAYGGNGIVYSTIGANLLCAMLQRRRPPLQALLGFQRLAD